MPEGSKVITFGNCGDLLGQLAAKIKADNGRIPTPAECEIDNVTIGPDGLTNYAWCVREALKILGYVSMADMENGKGR